MKLSCTNFQYDNHDTARNEMKVGKELSDAYIMMSLLLPGVGITYYGDEIGMENTMVRDDESTDTFRNGQRTPMQWDDSTNAGESPQWMLPQVGNIHY